MNIPAPTELSSTALLALSVYLLIKEVAIPLVRKNKNGSGTLKAGEQPTVFWEAKFGQLANIGEKQTDILKEIADTNNAIKESLAVVLDRTK